MLDIDGSKPAKRETTPVLSFRVPQKMWDDLVATAKRRGVTLASAARKAVQDYIKAAK